MLSYMSIHYITNRYQIERFEAADMYGTVTPSCGAYINAWKARFGGQGTTDPEAVTCKRCLKTMEPGMSVDLGHLVSPSRW